MLLPLLLLLDSSSLPPLDSSNLPTLDELHLQDCIKLANKNPQSGLVDADSWSKADGGYRADACRATAFANDGKFSESAKAFAAAGRGAALAHDPQEFAYWAQAGNAAIVAAMPEALDYLNAALGSKALAAKENAEILIDRARYYVGVQNWDSAKIDLASARALDPQDSDAWLFSATLARRRGEYNDAQAFIKTGAALAPRDAAIALEAGNIAAAAGAYDVAKEQWTQTIAIAPDSAQAKTAKAYLAQLAIP